MCGRFIGFFSFLLAMWERKAKKKFILNIFDLQVRLTKNYKKRVSIHPEMDKENSSNVP